MMNEQTLIGSAKTTEDDPKSVTEGTAVSKVFSFFAGSGLLDIAFEQSGFQVDFVNEYFVPFLDAYKYSRKELGVEAPIHGHSSASIEEYLYDRKAELIARVAESKKDDSLVGFIGGPPCPDFSIGGKNRGHGGDNGRLSKVYVDLITEVEPDWFLFENVKGLWRTKKHRDFYETLKVQLSEKYQLVDRVFNSIEAGAPQDRDRILLFGVKKAHKFEHPLQWDKGLAYPNRTAFEFPWTDTEAFAQDVGKAKPNSVPLDLTVQFWFDKNDVASHPNQSDCFTPRNGLSKFLKIDEGDVSRKSSKRLHRWRYSPTAAYGNNEVHLHPYKARRLSVAEALAIQSMPKEFVLPPSMTLSNKFKTIGNGVPYKLGSHIARAIKQYLEQNTTKKVL